MRVLVVEDEAIVSMLLEEFLEEMGCEITATASRFDDALEKARSLTLDLALLDVNLAGRLSYPVAELLLGRGVPVVFSTGYGASALPDALHGVTVLSKPFRHNQLAAAMQAAREGKCLGEDASAQPAG
ncbi:MAG TPA: response regulator [Acetobacteraceae bacterium]